MSLLILGVIVFFAVHFVPSSTLKPVLVNRIGEGPFKGLFSLVAALGLALIIIGVGQASFQALWSPLSWGRSVLFIVMPVVSILLVAAQMPNNIKRVLRHPMLIGIALWGVGHLAANGDVASSILFGSFTLFSVINILMVNARAGYTPAAAVSIVWDIGVIVIGLLVFVLFYYFHGSITGIPLR